MQNCTSAQSSHELAQAELTSLQPPHVQLSAAQERCWVRVPQLAHATVWVWVMPGWHSTPLRSHAPQDPAAQVQLSEQLSVRACVRPHSQPRVSGVVSPGKHSTPARSHAPHVPATQVQLSEQLSVRACVRPHSQPRVSGMVSPGKHSTPARSHSPQVSATQVQLSEQVSVRDCVRPHSQPRVSDMVSPGSQAAVTSLH